MKKRVVAVLLSLTMCSAMVAETGAAAIADPSAAAVSDAVFSDEVSDNAEEQNGNSEVQTEEPEGSDGGSITIEDPNAGEVPGDGTSDNADGEITDNNTGEIPDMQAPQEEMDYPEEEFSDGLFSSGDNMTETEQQDPVLEEENTEAAAASFESTDEKTHKATLLYTRWEDFQEKGWKLRKLPKGRTVQEDTVENAGVPEEPTADAEVVEPETVEPTADAETVEPEMMSDVSADATDETIASKTMETEASSEIQNVEITDISDEEAEIPMTIPETDTQQEIQLEETQAEQAGVTVEYFENTLMEITTVDSQGQQLSRGIYLFDKNGYVVSGKKNLDKTLDGYVELCDKKGNKGEYYFLELGKASVENTNTPAGDKITPYNSEFGHRMEDYWVCYGAKENARYRYYGENGCYQQKKTGAYKIFKDKNAFYLLNQYGALLKEKWVKIGKYYYYSNKYGQMYADKLVKIKGYRYYFTSSGKRATWKNRWVRLGKNTNYRYYYFGKVPGRVEEKKGIQKVTVNGKFVGWFLFTSGGNNVQNYWSKDRYFLSDGRMASGVTKVGKYYYFFERSSTTKCRGNRYKGTWVKYNNKYYYAASNGVLASNGWRNIRGGRYYFQNCTAVTNKTMKDPSTGKWGWLDSRGRYSTEWIIMDDAKNRARYMDPATGRVLKNTTKTINGKNYRFDKYGNRVSDRTSEFRQRSYYLECDRVNGVMTIYTNSKKNVPIKTIRVSVGNPWTPTPLMPNERIDRADRWQLLMGPSWGQYGTHVRGGIYIHSVASGQRHGNNLPAGEYLKLGNPASHGCIRCCVADAKWIWENCNGSRIRIFDGKYNANETFKGPLGRNPLTPLRGSGTFDPTDPEYN